MGPVIFDGLLSVSIAQRDHFTEQQLVDPTSIPSGRPSTR
jgi:hypothetical protein